MNRYLAQEKRVFDISKFTVVGSPTITSDGVASGFSGTVGIKVPPINPNNSSWEVYIEQQVTPEALAYTNTQFVLFTDAGDKGINIQVNLSYTARDNFICQVNIPNVGFEYDQLKLNCSSADGNKAVAGDIQGFKLGYDNSTNTYYFKVYKNGVEYASAQSVAEGIINQTTIATLIGYRTNVRGNLSLINLKSYYVKYDNQTVFTGTKPVHLLERRKEGFDLSKFAVVGSPTISEDGVASGLSNTNKVVVPFDSTGKSNFKISFPFNLVGDIQTEGHLVWGNTNGLQIYKYNNGLNFKILGSATGTESPYYNLENNVNYICNIEVSNNTDCKFTLVNENTGEIYLTKALISERIAEINQIWISQITSMVIDLKQFSITVDGKEVFTGAKEHFYMLQKPN